MSEVNVDRQTFMIETILLGPPGFNWCFSFAPDFQ